MRMKHSQFMRWPELEFGSVTVQTQAYKKECILVKLRMLVG